MRAVVLCLCLCVLSSLFSIPLDVQIRRQALSCSPLSITLEAREERLKTYYCELSYCRTSLANIRDAWERSKGSAPNELREQPRRLTVGRELELIIDNGPRILERIVDDALHVLGRLDLAQVEPEPLGQAIHSQVVLV